MAAVEFSDDGPGPGSAQMMRDAELWRAAEAGDGRLRARCYAFAPAVITAGSGEKDVAVDGLARVRRPTGGRRLYHAAGDFACAVAGPRAHPLLCGSVRDAYLRIGRLWQRVLARFGVATILADGRVYRGAQWCATTLADGDILSADGRKLVASAQRRGRRGVMQHGSLALRPGYAAAASALGCAAELLRAHTVALAEVAGREVSYAEVAAAWRGILHEEGKIWRE